MRILSVCILAAVMVGSQSSFALAQEAAAEERSDIAKLLTSYLQGRLAESEAVLKSLKDSGRGSVPQLLDAEDQIDKWQLHLRLATEGKLVADHPVFTELRRELGVPEFAPSTEPGKSEVVYELLQEYLRKKLLRAQQAYKAAVALHNAGRAVESDVLAAESKLQGLKLLFEWNRLRSPGQRE